MKSEQEFKKIISSGFWRHISRYSFIPEKHKNTRNDFCNNLYRDIINKKYHPNIPKDYVINNKHNGVTRLIPVLTKKDTCVYYFCVKALEDFLSEGYVDCTFGGFRLNGKIKEKEDDLFNEINEAPYSVSPFSYNPSAWVGAWTDFQKKAYAISREGVLSYFIIFDIANFYDSINLILLENKIRNSADKTSSEVVDLLFYFLKYWDRELSFYAPRTTGIPMDDFGDSSRLLANFFLQDYDKKIHNYCELNNSKYLRYADDQIILSSDKNVAEKILRFGSIELSKMGLNINVEF